MSQFYHLITGNAAGKVKLLAGCSHSAFQVSLFNYTTSLLPAEPALLSRSMHSLVRSCTAPHPHSYTSLQLLPSEQAMNASHDTPPKRGATHGHAALSTLQLEIHSSELFLKDFVG